MCPTCSLILGHTGDPNRLQLLMLAHTGIGCGLALGKTEGDHGFSMIAPHVEFLMQFAGSGDGSQSCQLR